MGAGRKNQNSPVGSPLSGNVSDSSANNSSKQDQQDRFLPIANVSRIMKKSLPANAKISKEAKESVQECVSEFISFITGEASDKCQREKRKTINGDDLLWAMTTLGFDNYVSPLKLYLNKYKESEGHENRSTSSSSSSMVIKDHHDDQDQKYHQLLPLSIISNTTSSTDQLQIFQGTNQDGNRQYSMPTLIMPHNFQSNINGAGYYSQLDAKLASKSFGNPARVIGFGENMMMTGAHIHIAKIHEIEGNANRIISTNLHHGLGW